MNFVFLMDPLTTVIPDKDTSFILMLGAHRRGHKIYFMPDGGMTLKTGTFRFYTFSVVPQADAQNHFSDRRHEILSEPDVHAIFIRSDPPFDGQYLFNTWLLDRLPPYIPVINQPSGIRTVNEKIWATQFKTIIPRTLISRNPRELLDFLLEEKDIIVKPTDGFGGSSIFHVQASDKNAKVTLEHMTRQWLKEIIVQQYLPAAQKGDKRILLLDGDPLGAVLRVHADDDHRNNFFAGGKPDATTITERDRNIIGILKPELQKLGLYFVGIDVIGDYLIEVNVTSPTGIQEMNRLYGQTLENRVIDFTEKLVEQARARI